MRVLDVHTGTEVYSKDVGEEIRCVELVFFAHTLPLLTIFAYCDSFPTINISVLL